MFAHAVERGQRYRSGAVKPEGTRAPTSDKDPQVHYPPTTWPGAKIPHAWLAELIDALSEVAFAATAQANEARVLTRDRHW